MAHGVSAYVTLRLPEGARPGTREPAARASASSVGFMWNSIGLLLLGGIAAGFTGHFVRGDLGGDRDLAVVMAAMYAMVHHVGETAGRSPARWSRNGGRLDAAVRGDPPIEASLHDRGDRFVGLLAILWLMISSRRSASARAEAAAGECTLGTGSAVTVCARTINASCRSVWKRPPVSRS